MSVVYKDESNKAKRVFTNLGVGFYLLVFLALTDGTIRRAGR